MMRQAVGVGVERGVAQHAVLEHHRGRRPACAPPARQTAPAGSRAHRRTASASECAECAVSFQRRRMVSRSAGSRIGSAPSARSGSATARLQQPDQPPRPAPRRVAASNRSLAYSSTPVDPGRRAVGSAPLDQPDRQVELRARRSSPAPRPPQAPAAPARAARRRRLERQHHLEQRMPRQRPRRIEHLDQPLERQILHGHRPQGCRPAPAPISSRNPGLPEVSVRSTSVLTKNPIRSSSAASVRPAIGLPIGDVGAGPEPRQQPRQRRLQHHEQARARCPAPAPPARGADPASNRKRHPRRRDGSPPPAAAGRPAARSAPAGPASACVQYASCRAIALAPSSSAPSTACCHSV